MKYLLWPAVALLPLVPKDPRYLPQVLAMDAHDTAPPAPAIEIEASEHSPSEGKSAQTTATTLHHAAPPRVAFEEYVYWASAACANNEQRGQHEATFGGSPTATAWDIERTDESRALRTASRGAVFYLIVVSIFEPFSTPWAFAQMGYGPGIATYTVLGAASTYSGWLLWKTYLGLDSDRHPLRGYGDLFYRLFGSAPRHLVNVCQSIELLLSASVTTLSVSQSLSQISRGSGGGPGLCFVVCLAIFATAGMLLGQVRTFRKFSWLANLSVWLGVVVMFICVGVAVSSRPNFVSTQAQYGPRFGPGPVVTSFNLPPDGYASGGSRLVGTANGILQAVCANGGAMLFVAFLAEMRRPTDFWKALLCAELLIYILYIGFGIVMYSYQGQFALNPAMQGLSPYRWQSVANALNIGSGLVAATLYSNVGLKIFYADVLRELFHAPALHSTRGKLFWAGLMPIYWAAAFVICSTLPMFSFVTGIIGAIFIMNFSFAIPVLLFLVYTIKKDGMMQEERFILATSQYSYKDTGFKRFRRGFMRRPVFNTWNAIYCMGMTAVSILGVYSSVVALKAAFSGNSSAVRWSCTPPV